MTRSAVAVAVAVAVAASALTPAAHAQESVSADAFVARIDRAIVAVDASSISPAEAADRIGLPLRVRMPWGEIRIAREPLLGTSEGALEDRLEAMRAAAFAARDARVEDRARVERALERAYRGVRARPSLFERARTWFLNAVGTLVDRLARLGGLSTILAIVAGLLIVAGLFLLIRKVGFVPERRRRRERDPESVERPDWNRLADEALARGDHAEAARLRFRALLDALEGRGAVPQTDAVTAGEAREAARRAVPDVAGAVDRAAGIFERAAYGHTPVAREEADVVADAERKVRTG